MSSLRCKLGWHDWSKFGDISDGYSRKVQFRECKRCGKISETSIYAQQVLAKQINEVVSKNKDE